ncbi:MAG TPA: hypothetical protein ENH10_09695 [Bacteroidetes bacterium]|nr:hypothetical protein BMS3Bbin04_00942 [bacterium BMS3Bbin04]HDO66281.1 hypothetical protein [Bacteroidota bacterium]HEX05406.1 hypothetical protein [Bacteroidota bacterium]
MRSRSRRLGRMSIPRAVRRNRILPAPGFLPMRDGVQVQLSYGPAVLDYVPQQMLCRPGRPESGLTPLSVASESTVWLRTSFGPSVN